MIEVIATRRVGESGLMIDLPDIAQVHRVVAWAREQTWATRLEEIVPGVSTLYLQGEGSALDAASRELSAATWGAEEREVVRRHHELPVRYDGPDLAEVAARSGLSETEVARAHAGAPYTIDFFGFSPGQAFFSGVPTPLRLPRRPTPRTRVPVGSVAIANGYTVIYPRLAPGGWNLIGTYVGEPLWRDDTDPPTVLGVGDTVTFVACDA